MRQMKKTSKEVNGKPKQECFVMRLSKEDKLRLKEKAKEQNLSISSYVRTTLLNNSK